MRRLAMTLGMLWLSCVQAEAGVVPHGGGGGAPQGDDAMPPEVKVMTLNLHGYHPMGERPRWLQNLDGTVSDAPVSAQLHYFTWDEVVRGHARRLDALARELLRVEPDFVFLQEVGAGSPVSEKTCEVFERRAKADAPDENTAFRLERRLGGYQAVVGCRGNRGWWTNANTFVQQRVVVQGPKGWEVIHDFGANPYPNAMIVEGFAFLVRYDWRVGESGVWNVPAGPGTAAVQYATVSQGGPWLLLVNLHAGHKVNHFEQAVAVRRTVSDFVSRHPERAQFGGLILGGDLNARLYRPVSVKSGDISEPSSAPWEMAVRGEFDLTRPDALAPFARELLEFNHSSYKPWSTIQDPQEAASRVERAIVELNGWMRSECRRPVTGVALREMLSESQRTQRCIADRNLPWPACDVPERIDHILVNDDFSLKGAAAIFTQNSWNGLEGVSDHPSVLAVLRWMPRAGIGAKKLP